MPTQHPNFVGSHNMSRYKEKKEEEEGEEEKEKKDEEMGEEVTFPRPL